MNKLINQEYVIETKDGNYYEEEIKNPDINEDIKRINSKESLVDYLLKEYYRSSEIIIDEYSTDAEVSEAKFKANYNELLKLKDKYIGGK